MEKLQRKSKIKSRFTRRCSKTRKTCKISDCIIFSKKNKILRLFLAIWNNMDKNALVKVAQKFKCICCDYTTSRQHDFNKHNLAARHLQRALGFVWKSTDLSLNTQMSQFMCKSCDYTTSRRSDYVRHVNTTIHGANEKLARSAHQSKIDTECNICNRKFSTRGNLYKHRTKCHPSVTNIEKTPDLLLEFITQSKDIQNVLVEQNKELQNKLIEQSQEYQKQILELTKQQQLALQNTSTTINHNTTTTTNNQFNLQFFLHEQCKDALNLVDFIESLHVQVSDLEATGRLGHVEGISRIFINGLRQLDLYKRPIHCTDIKRETLYVKDQDSWEKDNSEKSKLKQAVKKVSNKNIQQLTNWREQHPDFHISDTKLNAEFIQISLKALGGRDMEESEKYADKIMKNVLKEVIVDKTITG